jgi:hypothetical protein
MEENPNDRDIPETLVRLALKNSVIRGRELKRSEAGSSAFV